MNKSLIGIGIVTYNNLPVLEKCLPSWCNNNNCHLAIFDNGSAPDVVKLLQKSHLDHLVLATQNMGLCYARNRLIEYFRDHDDFEYVLLADSDVRFHQGMIDEMLKHITHDELVGFVGYPQANKGFPVSEQGEVEEIANECQLTRLRMWKEIGLFPETLQYYSGDSWKSTIAAMHGWKTVVIENKKGYDHFQHGSHVNHGVKEAMQKDAIHWLNKEKRFVDYWRNRILLGKGEQFRTKPKRTDSDENVHEISIEIDRDSREILVPDEKFKFTPKQDIEVLLWLSRQVSGNILEIGCHEGQTTMQLAINNPEKTIYAIDYSGDEPTLCTEQISEQPKSIELGHFVRLFRNVIVIDQRFDKYKMRYAKDVDFVFYDADLTYERVKQFSEKVLHYFFHNPKRNDRFLVWHDYVPNKHRSSHPEWLRLGEYVRRELSHVYQIQYVKGTDLAILTYPANE